MNLIVIMAGGAFGALMRYLVSGMVSLGFPSGTFAVNMVGCLLIGVVSTLLSETTVMPPQAGALLLTGFLGAFTTFSTFIMETVSMVEHGRVYTALLNLALQVLLGLCLVYIGILITRKMVGVMA